MGWREEQKGTVQSPEETLRAELNKTAHCGEGEAAVGGSCACSMFVVIRYQLYPRLSSCWEHRGTCGCRLEPSNLGAGWELTSESSC